MEKEMGPDMDGLKIANVHQCTPYFSVKRQQGFNVFDDRNVVPVCQNYESRPVSHLRCLADTTNTTTNQTDKERTHGNIPHTSIRRINRNTP